MTTILSFIFAFLAVGLRFLPHPANFTPIGALFIFLVARKGMRWSLLAFAALAVSDLVLGLYDPRLMVIVYASFAAMGLCAKGAQSVSGRWRMPAVILSGSVLFYLTTNFAVWALSSWYPHTLSGLMSSYVLALPFFRNALAGDLLWSGIFLGVHAWTSKRYGAPPPVASVPPRCQAPPLPATVVANINQ